MANFVVVAVNLCIIFVIVIPTGTGGFTCKNDGKKFSCPRPGEDSGKSWCCGSSDDEYCCDFDEHSDESTSVIKTIITIVGVLIGLSFVACCIGGCCFFCQGCYFYNKRNERRSQSNVPRGPLPETDSTGRPLYPKQQQFVAQDNSYPPNPENFPLTQYPGGPPLNPTYEPEQLPTSAYNPNYRPPSPMPPKVGPTAPAN